MSIYDREHRLSGERSPATAALVVPLQALDRRLIPLVGGKAANLGELTHAGFPVPDGLCVTTAAYALLSDGAGLESTLAELASTRVQESVRLAQLAAAARSALQQAPFPASCVKAITGAYLELSDGAPLSVAVRSSATTEDLPEASFAGQQETFLNIVGVEAVLAAVQRCWVSLWTDSAVSYRASRGIDPRTVRLAVVIQRMVDAQVSGVLFTANPLTGKRREIVIDANPGLGEAVVSGVTNPDHFVVETSSGEIVERRQGDKQVVIEAAPEGGTRQIKVDARTASCLSDAQVRLLAAVGAQVETHYGAPQDIEWAIDASGRLFLLQSRPVTTLFPLPVDVSTSDEALRVYLSFNVQQGTHQPFTPMGISAIRGLASSVVTLLGFPPTSPLHGPGFVTEAASRIFFDVTGALRSSFGRRMLSQSMAQAEVHAAIIFQQLEADPRLSLHPTPRLAFFRAITWLLIRTRLPWHLFQMLLEPRTAQRRLERYVHILRSAGEMEVHAPASTRLSAAQHLLWDAAPRLMRAASPVMLGGMLSFALAGRLLGADAQASELQVVLRGVPSNPTTEMTLSLWALSQEIYADEATTHLVQETPPERLAEAYRAGSLPPHLQRGLSHFLAMYGHRSVNELDLGVPRWSEDPTYVLNILATYQEMRDPALFPDAQFQRAAEEAEAMVAILSRRAMRHHWVRGLLVGFCLSRARALGGLREMPRFCISLLLSQARALLWTVGAELAEAGRLSQAGDIFFITMPEAREALTGTDLSSLVRERRASYEQELIRRHVPLVLLSDGTEPMIHAEVSASARGTLQGTPASPGFVMATARVILNPHGARLEHGEILVAPSTDPGWTPLFLTAGGLVMETGGAMAHGAIVAREYGIPAVVGVPQATERITAGSRIMVNGTTGTITLEPAERWGGSKDHLDETVVE